MSQEKYYSSQTPDPLLLYLIWLRLDDNVQIEEKVYMTFVDLLSHWGALWSVIFSLLALYFLNYNRTKFYEKNPDWNDFRKEFKVIKKIIPQKLP